MFIIGEKQQKNILDFSLDSLNTAEQYKQYTKLIEHQEILKLLNEASDSRFVTKRWNTAND